MSSVFYRTHSFNYSNSIILKSFFGECTFYRKLHTNVRITKKAKLTTVNNKKYFLVPDGSTAAY